MSQVSVPWRLSYCIHADLNSAWKPLQGPLTDWPLAVCDEKTVDLELDYIASDAVTRTGFTENHLIYFNPNQKWYYLSQQKPTELVLFRQTDTKYPLLKGELSRFSEFIEQLLIFFSGVPHSGFENVSQDRAEVPRESIETRVFLYY